MVAPMTEKLKPCKAESRRHTWKHIGNKTVRRETMQCIEFTRKGIYKCATCGSVKYGEAREQAHVTV